jgi:hypothetical protein
MTALRRFQALPRTERGLLLRTMLAVQLIKAGMGLLPFRVLQRLLAGVVWVLRHRAPAGSLSVEQVAWAVEVASKRTVGSTTCLVEALAAQVVLAAQGHPARLRLGVARTVAGGVQAHAWVESDGRVVIGGSASDLERFSCFPALDEYQRLAMAVSPRRETGNAGRAKA